MGVGWVRAGAGAGAGAAAGVYSRRMLAIWMCDDEMILGFWDVRIREERLWEMSDDISRMGVGTIYEGVAGEVSMSPSTNVMTRCDRI